MKTLWYGSLQCNAQNGRTLLLMSGNDPHIAVKDFGPAGHKQMAAASVHMTPISTYLA